MYFYPVHLHLEHLFFWRWTYDCVVRIYNTPYRLCIAWSSHCPCMCVSTFHFPRSHSKFQTAWHVLITPPRKSRQTLRPQWLWNSHLSVIHRRSHMGVRIRCHHRWLVVPCPSLRPNLNSLPPGPYGANIFNPRAWGNPEEHVDVIIIEFTRVVLAIGVFTIGVELPKAYVVKHWKSLFFLLVPGPIWVRVLSLYTRFF